MSHADGGLHVEVRQVPDEMADVGDGMFKTTDTHTPLLPVLYIDKPIEDLTPEAIYGLRKIMEMGAPYVIPKGCHMELVGKAEPPTQVVADELADTNVLVKALQHEVGGLVSLHSAFITAIVLSLAGIILGGIGVFLALRAMP